MIGGWKSSQTLGRVIFWLMAASNIFTSILCDPLVHVACVAAQAGAAGALLASDQPANPLGMVLLLMLPRLCPRLRPSLATPICCPLTPLQVVWTPTAPPCMATCVWTP
jgi:hypothetical protein